MKKRISNAERKSQLLRAIEKRKIKDLPISIAAIARDVDIKSSQIHNQHHDIVAIINDISSKKHKAPKPTVRSLSLQSKNRELRDENMQLRIECTKLASTVASLEIQLESKFRLFKQ